MGQEYRLASMGHLSQDLSQTVIKVSARASVWSQRTVSEGPLSVTMPKVRLVMSDCWTESHSSSWAGGHRPSVLCHGGLSRRQLITQKLLPSAQEESERLWTRQKSQSTSAHPLASDDKHPFQDFPGGSVVKNLPCSTGDITSIPGWGTKIPHALEQLSPRATTRVHLLQHKISHDAMRPDTAKKEIIFFFF